MRSRTIGAPTLRALAAACLAIVLVAALLALSGCGLLGGDTPSTTPRTPASSTGATSSAEATGTDGAAGEAAVQASDASPKGVSGDGAARRARSARVVCVDTKPEYRREHVKGASNVPMKSLVDASADWRKSDDVLVTSVSEARSLAAAGYLTRNGFTDVYYIQAAYDGWNGKFEGTGARERTQPVEVYYIYISDVDDFMGVDGAGFQAIKDLTKDMDALKREYDDISFTFVDASTNPAEANRLVDRFGIPSVNLGFGNVVWVPHWVLVDWNGDVRHVNVVPEMPQIQFVFGFITAEIERLEAAR